MQPNTAPSAPRLAIAGLSGAVFASIAFVLWPAARHADRARDHPVGECRAQRHQRGHAGARLHVHTPRPGGGPSDLHVDGVRPVVAVSGRLPGAPVSYTHLTLPTS